MLILTCGQLVRPPAASAAGWHDTARWYDGSIAYSKVINCWGLIQGTPYQESGVGAYAGYLADPEQGHPAVGEQGWIHYSVYGMGNPCSGGSYFSPQFLLPAGMQFDTSRQIACGYDGRGATAPAAACPGWSNLDSSGRYANNENGQAGMWGVAQGHHWEFQVPVKASQPITNGTLRVNLKVLDGNSDPTLVLQAPVYVWSAPAGGGSTSSGAPTVMYDQPSTVSATWFDQGAGIPARYGLLSSFNAVVNGAGGVARMEISTSPTMSPVLGQAQMSFPANAYSAIKATTDWDESGVPALVPGTRYYWRGVVVPTGQAPVVGSVQSFTFASSGNGVATTSGGLTGTDGGSAGNPGSPGALGGTLTITKVKAKVTAAPVKKVRSKVRGKVQVKVSAQGGQRATGRVSIYRGAKRIGTARLGTGSKAVVKLARLKRGSHRLSVRYAGDTRVKAATATLRLRVR